MKYTKTQTLKDVLHQYVETMKLNAKLRETNLIMNWDKYVGTMIARATTKIYISQGKLFVQVNSAIVRHELTLIREELLIRINNDLMHNAINEIIIT